jgi:quercetin dioxygenase-like cupin family protein
MWSLVLSALAIVFSATTSKDQKKTSYSGLPENGSGILDRADRVFLSGAVLGIGLSLLYNAAATQFRIHERLRYTWHSIWRDEERETNWYEGSKLCSSGQVLTETENGSIRLILSPENAETSSLNVSVITLHPGREIPPTRSNGVEFYYVLSGTGCFSQYGVSHTPEVKAGDAFVIHPDSTRWIANSKNQATEEFVLLRATDAGCSAGRNYQDIIQMDPNYRTKLRAMDKLKDGLKQVQTMATDFVKSTSRGTFRTNNLDL